MPQKAILVGSAISSNISQLFLVHYIAPILVITASNSPFLMPVVRNSGSFPFIYPDSRFEKYDHNIHQQRCSKLREIAEAEAHPGKRGVKWCRGMLTYSASQAVAAPEKDHQQPALTDPLKPAQRTSLGFHNPQSRKRDASPYHSSIQKDHPTLLLWHSEYESRRVNQIFVHKLLNWCLYL